MVSKWEVSEESIVILRTTYMIREGKLVDRLTGKEIKATDVCLYFNVSKTSAYRWISDGSLLIQIRKRVPSIASRLLS